MFIPSMDIDNVLCVHKLNIASFAVPSAPLDPSVELVNSTAVTLKWSPPDSPNGNLLYYRITFYGYKTDSKVSQIYTAEFLIYCFIYFSPIGNS